MNKIRLAVIDDHPMFREGVASILASEPDIEIVGQGSSAESAIQLAQSFRPDIMLLDINMPGGGLEAARSIKDLTPAVKLIILTGSEEDDLVIKALKAGVSAYLLKGILTRELIEVLHLVQSGQSYVSPVLAAGLLKEMSQLSAAQPIPNAGPLDRLSEREGQILALIGDGLGNQEIGLRLGLAEKTVKHYVTGLFQKLGVQNRVQAALFAQKNKR